MLTKNEISVKMTVCGMKSKDLTTGTTIILDIHFFYNQKLQIWKTYWEKYLFYIKCSKFVKNETMVEKTAIFTTSALSTGNIKLRNSFSEQLLKKIWKIQEVFIWNNLTLKIKHEIVKQFWRKWFQKWWL